MDLELELLFREHPSIVELYKKCSEMRRKNQEIDFNIFKQKRELRECHLSFMTFKKDDDRLKYNQLYSDIAKAQIESVTFKILYLMKTLEYYQAVKKLLNLEKLNHKVVNYKLDDTISNKTQELIKFRDKLSDMTYRLSLINK